MAPSQSVMLDVPDVATLATELCDLTDRIEAAWQEHGFISNAEAAQLRDLRIRAERIFGEASDQALRVVPDVG